LGANSLFEIFRPQSENGNNNSQAPIYKQIPNYNVEISNKIKNELFEILNFSHWDLFVICYLDIGICLYFVFSTLIVIFCILWQNIFATKPPRHKARYQKCFSFVPLGPCGSFSGLSGYRNVNHHIQEPNIGIG